MSSRIEVTAACITAGATAIQAAVVAIALYVATKERFGHEDERISSRQQRIIDLHFNEPAKVDSARSFVVQYIEYREAEENFTNNKGKDSVDVRTRLANPRGNYPLPFFRAQILRNYPQF